MASIMFRPQFGDFFAERLAYIDEVLFLRFPHHAPHYGQIFKVKDSSRSYEEVTGVSGLGLFQEKAEGEAVVYDRLYQLYDKRFTHITYASGVQASLEFLHYNQDEPLMRGAEALGRAGNVSSEMTVWAVINNAATSETTPDGQYIFADSHPLIGGGTFDNKLTGELTLGTLEDAINKFADMVDNRGLLIAVAPKMLVIPPELRIYASMWLQSELLPNTDGTSTGGGLGSGDANPPGTPDFNWVNAINPIKGMGISYFVSPYLTDSDAWMLMGDLSESPFVVYWGIRPTPDHTIDFDTGNAKSKLVYALSCGAKDWRPVVGSIPA